MTSLSGLGSRVNATCTDGLPESGRLSSSGNESDAVPAGGGSIARTAAVEAVEGEVTKSASRIALTNVVSDARDGRPERTRWIASVVETSGVRGNSR